MKTLLLTKRNKWCKTIQGFMREKVPETIIYGGEVGDPLPDIDWKGDYLISFLSPWIIPKKWLDKTKFAINFHPAPPEYPGLACYNYAIYNQEREFGVNCHYMLPKIDSGKIIQVNRFPIKDNESVDSLRTKSRDKLIDLFYELSDCIISGRDFPSSNETWGKPYTRKDLLKLCRITPEMSNEEVRRRIRATYLPGAKDGPYIELFGNKFSLDSKKE
jgi:methionyl-tRNA formyltransferase